MQIPLAKIALTPCPKCKVWARCTQKLKGTRRPTEVFRCTRCRAVFPAAGREALRTWFVYEGGRSIPSGGVPPASPEPVPGGPENAP